MYIHCSALIYIVVFFQLWGFIDVHILWVTHTHIVDNICCGLHVVEDTYMLWMYTVDIVYILWIICCGNVLWVTLTYVVENKCCGLHVVDDTYMLWVYVVDIILYTVDYMLWVHVVGNTYLCCGEHVVHNMYPTT